MPANGSIASACRPRAASAAASSRLDDHGNSVRGLKVCEMLSTHFGLHMLNRSGDVRTSIIADYDIGGIASRRSRQPRDQQILEEHHDDVRVIELVGALTFATIDYVSRKLAEKATPLLIVDFRRVASITSAGGLLLADILRSLTAGTAKAILTGIEPSSQIWTVIHPLIAEIDRKS